MAVTASVKQMEKKFRSLNTEKRPLEKNIEKLMRSYDEQKAVFARIVGYLVKSVASRFLCMTKFFDGTVLNRSLREIFELVYFSEDLSWHWTAHCEQRFWSVIDTSGREHVVPLHQFSLIGVGNYKQPFSS